MRNVPALLVRLGLLAALLVVAGAASSSDATERARAIASIKGAMHAQDLDAYCRVAPDIVDFLHEHDRLSWAEAQRRTNVAIGRSLADFMTIATAAAIAYKSRHNDESC